MKGTINILVLGNSKCKIQAHERTIQTDILFGIVKKAQRVRTLKAGMSRLKVRFKKCSMFLSENSRFIMQTGTLTFVCKQLVVT